MKRTVIMGVFALVMGLACGAAWAVPIGLNYPSFESSPCQGWELWGYAGTLNSWYGNSAYDGGFVAYGDGYSGGDSFFRQFLSSPQTYQANTVYTLTFYALADNPNARVYGRFNWGYADNSPQGAVVARTEFTGLDNGTYPSPNQTMWKKCEVVFDTLIHPSHVGQYITFDIGFVHVPNYERSYIDAVSLDASPVSASVLFETGFEYPTYTPGALVDENWGGQDGWYGMRYDAATWQPRGTVINDAGQAHTGSQCLRIPAEIYYYNSYVHEFALQATGRINYEAWYKLGAVGANGNNTNNFMFDMGNRQGKGNGTTSALAEEFHTPYGGDVAGGYSPDNVSLASTWLSYSGISGADQWKGMRISADLDNDVMDVWVKSQSDTGWTKLNTTPIAMTNNDLMASAGSIAIYQLCNDWYSGRWNTDPFYNGSNYLYVDDIKVWTGTPTVHGSVVLNDWVGPNGNGSPEGQQVTVELRGTTTRTDNVTLNAAGQFTLTNVVPDNYAVSVKASHWLAKLQSIEIGPADAEVTIPTAFSLVNGDCNGDNNITDADLSILVAAMDTLQGETEFDPRADLDGDREITSTDLSINLASTDPMVQLVANGQAKATIVLEEQPTVSAQLAAYELQYHLFKMSGATLPIIHEPQTAEGTVILVGESNATRALGYHNDDFAKTEYLITRRLDTGADSLVLMGYDNPDHRVLTVEDYNGDLGSFFEEWGGPYMPIGSCYAVHTFLERTLGVRWYLPTEVGEVIPAMATVSAEIMATRRKVDAPYRHYPVYPLAVNKQLYYNDYQAVNWNNITDHWDLRSGILYWIRNKWLGGLPVGANHSFNGWDQAFGQTHPEWFSTKIAQGGLSGWALMQTLNYQQQVQPCLNNQVSQMSPNSLFNKNLEIMDNYFAYLPLPFPGAYDSGDALLNTYGIGLNDNNDAFCQCDNCTPQYHHENGWSYASNYFWNYVNRLAQARPGKQVVGLAYSRYTDPPTGITFAPNLGVMLCRFPYQFWDNATKNADHARVQQYLDNCSAGALYAWIYLVHPWVDMNPFPPVIPRLNADDAKFLTSFSGFKGGGMQYNYNTVSTAGAVWSHPVLDHFRLYFRMKLYDDKSLDVDTMLSEYYTKFYGPNAAAPVRAFIEALENRWCNTVIPGATPAQYCDTPSIWWGTSGLGTPAFITQLQGLMASAKTAAGTGNVYRSRVDLLDQGILQLIINNRAKYSP